MDSVGTRIRALRKAKHLSQTQLGEAVGIDQSTISDIESKGAKFSADILMSLCDALAATPEMIMRGEATNMPPFSRISMERFRGLSLTDQAYIEGRLEAALDSLSAPPPKKPPSFFPLSAPRKKAASKKAR